MTLDRVSAVARFYADVTSTVKQNLIRTVEDRNRFAHLDGMVPRLLTLCAKGRTEKAMRWLGFMQGTLWVFGRFSIEELKDHNRPDFPEPG